MRSLVGDGFGGGEARLHLRPRFPLGLEVRGEALTRFFGLFPDGVKRIELLLEDGQPLGVVLVPFFGSARARPEAFEFGFHVPV